MQTETSKRGGPVQLEAAHPLRMPGGHIFHRDLAWPFAESEHEVGSWGVETERANVWICGAGGMALRYAIRIHHFANLVRHFEPPPHVIRLMVAEIANRLGLKRAPDVLMTSRALPPLVWSIGASPHLILPTGLFARLNMIAQSTVLAHELVHVSRRDHLVRLLELAATENIVGVKQSVGAIDGDTLTVLRGAPRGTPPTREAAAS